jgi:hypothetical protein
VVELYAALGTKFRVVSQAPEKFAERVAVLAYFAIPRNKHWDAANSSETT